MKPASDGSWPAVRLPEGWRLRVFGELDSTNEFLKREAPARHGDVVVAERQTAGRGRRGAAWISEEKESLTFSVRLRPEAPKSWWSRLSLATGLAVAEALGRAGLEAGVKWPNDVWIAGRKVCGILVEAVDDAVIIGVGVNIGQRTFPGPLRESATSLWLEGARDARREELLGWILGGIGYAAERLGEDFGEVLDRIRERCVLTGERVELTSGNRRIAGVARGIGDRGELLLETDTGLERLIQADEVRITQTGRGWPWNNRPEGTADR